MGNWLEVLRGKQARVNQLKEELRQLEQELRDAKAILSGREGEPDQMRPKSRHGFTGGKRARPIQYKSSVWWTQRALFVQQQPMQVDDILEAIRELGGPEVKKPTLVSNLSRYVTHGDTFNRPAPSVFGLIDFTKDAEGEVQ